MENNASLLDESPERITPKQGWVLTILACVGTTIIATPLLGYLDLANIVMLFLLTVLLVAVKLGRNAAILASILSVLLFDIFFVPPRFSLAVSNIQYLVTFAVMLVTALITAHLAAGLRQRARESQSREKRTQALYQFARELAGTLTTEQVVEISRSFIKMQLNAQSAILMPHPENESLMVVSSSESPLLEMHLAQVALKSGQLVRSDEVGGMGYAPLYLPLRASMRIRGVLAIRFADDVAEPSAETTSLLETLASLVAVAVERLHYVDVAQASEVKMLTERLRSSILSALSHDLRTPLTAMVGLADSLFLIKPALPATALETAQALHEQADRLAGLVGNLLDMARLNAGEVTLRREWQPLEEVVGAGIKLLGSALAAHPVKVELPRDLPLLEFDAVLIERVLCNLLENAAKYSPDGTPILLAAEQETDVVRVSISDHGPGFPAKRRDDLFKMFVRGESESGKPGTGLGLAICKAIVEAHGGTITADNRPDGGACVSFTLPKGVPPVVEEELA
ncbi:MAG: ATP-binding region, ATPase-like:Histidine kinase N-terminal [Proteobacteria bacterium]|nr:ATP-binding region, ATPase-like:Histidine kinase N-terminal [Pseudomonadota bacterium]